MVSVRLPPATDWRDMSTQIEQATIYAVTAAFILYDEYYGVRRSCGDQVRRVFETVEVLRMLEKRYRSRTKVPTIR